MKRKPPKNQRPYASPSGKKARMVEITDPDELRLLFRGATEIGVPVLYQPFLTNKFFCDAELMRKWRASQTTSTGEQ
jgi:hypothetical protein